MTKRMGFMALLLLTCLWALSAAGQATAVTIKIKQITLDKAKATVYLNDQLQLAVARVLPALAADKSVTWGSTNKAIAKVDENGLVTPVKPGTVNIYAKAADGSAVKGICRVTVTRVYRRALVIGCGAANRRYGAVALPAIKLEVNGVAEAMRTSRFDDGYGINVSTVFNQKKSAVRAAIARKFKDAKADDVSYVYLTGHGYVSGKEYYALPATDTAVSAAELRKMLDPIPGTVVLVVNTCKSGAVLGVKGAEDFSLGFLEAFLGAEPVAKTAIGGAKYQILCATNAKESGYTYIDGFDYVNGQKRVRHADTFGTPFAAGIGFDYLEGAGVRSWLADENFDGQITHRELLAYLRGVVGKQLAGITQTVTAYPAGGSGFLLFAQERA